MTLVNLSNKTPLNTSSALSVLLPLLSAYFVTALLTIQPGTVFWRRLLLPFTLWFALRAGASLDLSGGDPAKAHANQSFALHVCMISMRCIEWAVYSAQVKPLQGTPADVNARRATWSSLFLSAGNLAVGPRELDWQGPSKPKTLRKPYPFQRRSSFIRHRALSFGLHLVLSDFLLLALQSFSPEIGTPEGGSVFDPSLPASRRYLRSTLMTLFLGSSIYTMTRTFYDGISVVGVFIFRQSPSQWPPLFSSPWRATSLKELWGERWHHLNRSWIINLGAKPMYRVFGPAGGVLGAFTISGLMHDLGLRAVGRGSDFLAVVGFFFVMGVGVILESVWIAVQGKTPSGVAGWLWTFGWVALWGHVIADAWLIRGAAAAGIIPEGYRPSKAAWAFMTA